MPSECYATDTPALAVEPTTPSAEASRSGWAVIATHPHAEQWAIANLQRAGYQTYLPLYIAIRRDPVLRTLTRHVLAPLFPGYAFLRLSNADPWIPIYHSPGVKSLLKSHGKPEYVPEAEISRLQASEASRRTPMPPGARWRPGDACTPANGPFRKQPAVITSIRDNHATISLMLFGHLRDITIPLKHLSHRDEQ